MDLQIHPYTTQMCCIPSGALPRPRTQSREQNAPIFSVCTAHMKSCFLRTHQTFPKNKHRRWKIVGMGGTSHTVNMMLTPAAKKTPNKSLFKVLYRTFIFNFVANLISAHPRKMQFVIKHCGRKHICVDKVIFIPSKGEYTGKYCFKLF